MTWPIDPGSPPPPDPGNGFGCSAPIAAATAIVSPHYRATGWTPAIWGTHQEMATGLALVQNRMCRILAL